MPTRCTLPSLAFLFFVSVALLSSPGLAVDSPEPDLVRAYVEIWNSGETDQLSVVVHEDFQRFAGPGETTASIDELAELIRQTRERYGHFQLIVQDSFETPDGGAFRGTFRGVHSAVGKVVEFPVAALLRARDGRLIGEWILGDNFLALMALGYQLTPPGFEVVDPSTAAGQESAP